MSEPQKFKFLLLSDKATFPTKANEDDAGWDISSAEDTIVPARGKAKVKTDLKVRIPYGTYGRIAPRSGLTWKNSIDTGAGVIDYIYLGEILIILFNHSDDDFKIKIGDRIAQFILEKINLSKPELAEANDPDFDEKATTRGAKGFGSSG